MRKFIKKIIKLIKKVKKVKNKSFYCEYRINFSTPCDFNK